MFNELRKAYKPEIATQFTSERAQFQLEQLNKTIENGHTEARRAYWANLSDMGLDSEIRMDEFGRAYIPDAILALLPTKEMARFIEACVRYNAAVSEAQGARNGSKRKELAVEEQGRLLAELKMFEPKFTIEMEFQGGTKVKVPQPEFKRVASRGERQASNIHDMWSRLPRMRKEILHKSEWLRRDLEALEREINESSGSWGFSSLRGSLHSDLIDLTQEYRTLQETLSRVDPEHKWEDAKALAELHFS